MSGVKFGTSGLRGLVAELTNSLCRRYMRAFLHYMEQTQGLKRGDAVLIGRDLRASSPRIAAAVAQEIKAQGFTPLNCGEIPTPALAYAAISRRAPAVMITGSHIPDDRNGLKFYRPDGEIDKQDEAALLKLAAADNENPADNKMVDETAILLEESHKPRADYIKRAVEFLPRDALSGLHIGVYQHSTVQRDILTEIITALGAQVTPLHRSEKFIPVDTEALRGEDRRLAREAAAKDHLDAIISADGDGDRPLLADEKGEFLHGDILGILTAYFLHADYVVTPVSSTTAVEKSGFFAHIDRCRIGSPFVLAAMEAAKEKGAKCIAGFEANGGFLLGSDINGLKALPTRDAVLPILCVLALAKQKNLPVSALPNLIPKRITKADRLTNYPLEKAHALLTMVRDEKARQKLLEQFGAVTESDETDGIRLTLADGDIIHFRASGNAPELRCYAEADSAERAEKLLEAGLNIARRFETA